MASLNKLHFPNSIRYALNVQNSLNPMFSPPVRHNWGYIPFEGRLNTWDIEPNRINREIKRINLKPVKRMHFAFDPFHPSVRSIRHIIYYFSSEKVRTTNPKCAYKTDVLTDRSDPLIKVELAEAMGDVDRITFKTADLKVEEILSRFNDLILPLVKDDVVEERTTKGVKKAAGGKKGKK